MNQINIDKASYNKMWDDFGREKAQIYLSYKFLPNYRVGLTNFLREEKIYDFLKPALSDSVADIGCASGRQLILIADKIAFGAGTDISQPFIDAAKAEAESKKIKNLEFSRAEIELLPYEDGKFDKIICGEVIEHVYDKDVALRELLRVLKPSGELIISVPNLNADGTWWGRLLRMLRLRSFISLETYSREELMRHGDAHVREFTGESLSKWLKSRGLTVNRISSVSYLDGPYGDVFLKVLLHIPPIQKLLIALERMLAGTGMLWGRHLVVSAKKC